MATGAALIAVAIARATAPTVARVNPTPLSRSVENVPNSGSVNPPEFGQDQLVLSTYAVGAVVQIVAASFHAMHAVLSPALNGNVPPSCVGAVMLYELVTHPAIGDVHP